MDYSLQSNIDFYLIMNTLGLEKKDIKKIYLIKNTIDYIKSILISLIILIPTEIFISIILKKLYITQFRGTIDFNIPVYAYILSMVLPYIVIYIFIFLISITIVYRYTSIIKKMRVN